MRRKGFRAEHWGGLGRGNIVIPKWSLPESRSQRLGDPGIFVHSTASKSQHCAGYWEPRVSENRADGSEGQEDISAQETHTWTELFSESRGWSHLPRPAFPAHLLAGSASSCRWVCPLTDSNALENLAQLSEPRYRDFPLPSSKPPLLTPLYL